MLGRFQVAAAQQVARVFLVVRPGAGAHQNAGVGADVLEIGVQCFQQRRKSFTERILRTEEDPVQARDRVRNSSGFGLCAGNGNDALALLGGVFHFGTAHGGSGGVVTDDKDKRVRCGDGTLNLCPSTPHWVECPPSRPSFRARLP